MLQGSALRGEAIPRRQDFKLEFLHFKRLISPFFPGSLCRHHGLSICQHCLFLIRVTYSLYGLHVGRDVQTVGQFRGFKPLVSIAERASVVAWKRSNVCCAIPDVFGRESFVSNGEVLR